MRCFGWFYKGFETEASNIIDVDINWDTGKATASRRFYEWITFKRVSPYTGNLFFKLCELLMTLFSWLRIKIIPLLAGLLVDSSFHFCANCGYPCIRASRASHKEPAKLHNSDRFLLSYIYAGLCVRSTLHCYMHSKVRLPYSLQLQQT